MQVAERVAKERGVTLGDQVSRLILLISKKEIIDPTGWLCDSI